MTICGGIGRTQAAKAVDYCLAKAIVRVAYVETCYCFRQLGSPRAVLRLLSGCSTELNLPLSHDECGHDRTHTSNATCTQDVEHEMSG